jgi:hypothetical protein
VSQDRIAQGRVRSAAQHRGLRYGNQFARFHAECREAEDAIAMSIQQRARIEINTRCIAAAR